MSMKYGRIHQYVHIQEIADAFGIPGEPVRLWMEPDAEYVHIITLVDEEEAKKLGLDVKPQFEPGKYPEATETRRSVRLPERKTPGQGPYFGQGG